MQKSKILLLVTFIIFGTVVAAQVRTTIFKNQQKAASVLNVELLAQQLQNEEKIAADLKDKIKSSSNLNNEMLKKFLEGNNEDGLLLEYQRINLLAGLTDVKGPGIEIVLDDAPARKGEDARYLKIHDSDIKQMLNELKKAGVQALSINGERIVSTSEQVCAGPTILINGSRYSVPYTIKAIGNSDTLYEVINNSEYVAILLSDKIKVEIKKSNNVMIPRYNNDLLKLEKKISKLEDVNK